MKLIKRIIERGGEGTITLQPQEDEDMWHIYNIVAVGDSITASAIRKVQKESSTGSSSQSRVRFNLTLEVLHVDFDVQASKIRIRGRNVTESEYIKMGQHHTIELELGKNFSLFKTCWDSIYLERVDMACDPRNLADLAAIVMQQGLAHVCLITPNMTLIRAKIEVSVPRKRAGSTGHDKAMSRFFDAIIEAVTRHINFSIVKCVVIASPGYVAEDYSSYMFEQAIKKDIKQISENKSKFMICHSSSGFKHALREVLADPAVAVKVAETKAYSEVKALADFFEMLNEDEHRAFYGFNLIKRANEEKAVATLLVTDDLFRNANLHTRKQYVELVERVRENGGEVHVFSSLHVSGEQLSKLGGVAAILRFPLVIEDDEPEPDSDDEKKAAPTTLPPLSASAAKGPSGVEEDLSDEDSAEEEPKGARSAVEAVDEEDGDGGAGDLDGTDD